MDTSKERFQHRLLYDDEEYIEGASYVGARFVMLLISESLSRPEFVWEQTWHIQSDYITHRQKSILQIDDLQLSDDQLKNYALAEIEKISRRAKLCHAFSRLWSSV
ncbi:hypothetical protein POM88_038358 [Heracleum sosnowskyi]|uniref:Uncharacterized protein n=1 Tax=Heracleum sosnowskyi TaxID=360622 RepID=A0AAD8H7S6_9APIA|nr:hypothetical protein POM88_038358 [Heracleum sosnowskyi]